MPNWCDTEYRFYGKRKDIAAFHDKLEEWTAKSAKKNGFGNDWLGNILIGAGFDYETNEAGKIEGWGHISCRGTLTYLGDISVIDDDTAEFNAGTETAWCAMPRLWLAVIQKHGWKIKFDFLETEPGMGVYCRFYGDEHQDTEKQYYVDSYGVDRADDEKLNELLREFQDENVFCEEELKESLSKVLRHENYIDEANINELISEAEALYNQAAEKDGAVFFSIKEIEIVDMKEIMANG